MLWSECQRIRKLSSGFKSIRIRRRKMIKQYRKWLFMQNKNSGKKMWWLVFAVGLLLVLLWIASIMPCVAIFTSTLSVLGKIEHSGGGIYELIVYGHWVLQEPTATYYICSVILCLPFALVGYLMILIGANFAIGWFYVIPVEGYPTGCWIPRIPRK